MNKNLDNIDRYIAEAIRVRRAIQIYDELYCSEDSVNTLLDKAGLVFGVLQRALHDEIVISLSRLFDSDSYDTKHGRKENLSQHNIVKANHSLLTKKDTMLCEQTKALLEEINIKSYRNQKIAHNDKDSLVSYNKKVKHGVTSEKAKELIEFSIDLMISIKAKITQNENVSLPVNLTENYEGYALKLVDSLKKI